MFLVQNIAAIGHKCLQGIELYTPHHSSQWRCEPCGLSFPSELSLRNHLNGHKMSQLRDVAPKLSLPATARQKTRRKRGNGGSHASLDEPSIVTDCNIMLAPPVAQEPLVITNASDAEDDPGPLAHLHEAFDCLLEGPPSEDYFATFERCVQAILHLFPEGSDRRVPSSSSLLLLIWMTEPHVKNCTNETAAGLFGKSWAMPVSAAKSHSFPFKPFSLNVGKVGRPILIFTVRPESQGRVDLLDSEFSPKEVWSLLKKAENTAPGPDRLTYHHLRTVDPGARLLSRTFNLCVRFRRVPSSWKASTTILIPKGGDPSEVSNWRPIALSNTSYKIFTKCLASRLSAWCERYDTISFCQKGFMPHDGVLEHNFILQQAVEQARSSKKDICIAWLDVTNAFGALPHSALFDSLRALNVGESMVRLIEDIYSGSVSSILTEEGTSEPIPIRSGVKQGCPLSGLLFNIALDPVIQSLQGASNQHKMSRLCLHLNPQKSFSLHLRGSTPVGTCDTSFTLNDHQLHPVHEGDFHKFLGKPVGFNAVPDYSSLNDLAQLGVKLAPWQRLDALKTFFFSSLQFPMRTAQFPKGDWKKIDKLILKEVKSTLNLPTEASNEYIYGNRKLGCCGLPISAEDADINLVDSAFKLLSSRDALCAERALPLCIPRFAGD
ncbi:retrovirus-related Pol polyprotein from type-2 retrotransposable element R2DM [Caerostris darwini]|uniref:Retrovirus-related Pol polyprotein from type-2 retrotransposable element R2DM n=1 Tax=Caerostris darwini TaxID=1538125 RepID=A0AAV4QS47_9ARAC|nr:retrovirus-related Pol polyprotein from type-2 retrotransposable element R2DM [Caerostris darwini]